MASSSGGFRRVLRRLIRTPLFTTVTVVTLGVGIGATAAIFSVVYGVLLKPLPFVEPDRLVGLWHTAPGVNIQRLNMSPSLYYTYRDVGQIFERVGVWTQYQVTIIGRGDPERARALGVTEDILPLLGARPLLGRIFTPADDVPNGPRYTILTYGYWQRKFGGAADVVGKQINIEGRMTEVIGVLPQSFKFLNVDAALLLPMQFNRATTRIGNFSFQGMARLKPGVTIEQANRDIGRMIPMSFDRFPFPSGVGRAMFESARIGPNLNPLSYDAIGDVGRILWVLLGTVGIVLLIACANVANLFLVRTEARQQELALRAALGASRGRMARELLTESVGLALVAGLFGLMLAQAGIGLLRWIAPSGLPRLGEIDMNPVVLVFTLAVSIVTGLLFGLIPVFKFGAPNAAALKDGGRSTSDSPTRHRARHALIVAEISLALVLLIVSGLMIRTFLALRAVEPGFVRAEEVQTFRVSIPDGLISDPKQTLQAFQQIYERLAQVPGVTSVGLTSSITMDGTDTNDPVFVEEFPTAPGQIPPIRRYKFLGPGYVETMGNRMVAGRTLTWRDAAEQLPSVLISENLAREFWKNPADAIGKRIRQSEKNPWREIVGVVANEYDDGVQQRPPTIVYWPMMNKQFWEFPITVSRNMAFAVRSQRTSSPTLLRELQQAVWAVNPSLPLSNVRTLDGIRSSSMAQTSFALVMLAIAASVALLLGIVGIYGVIAYIAAQRTREIGIRMALGAQTRDVSRLFIRHGLWLTGIGVVIGIAAASGLTRLMSALLFGVAPLDPMTYAAVSIGLAAVAMLATYLPARRAARIDPITALRSDV